MHREAESLSENSALQWMRMQLISHCICYTYTTVRCDVLLAREWLYWGVEYARTACFVLRQGLARLIRLSNPRLWETSISSVVLIGQRVRIVRQQGP